jgi:hypothetical protein
MLCDEYKRRIGNTATATNNGNHDAAKHYQLNNYHANKEQMNIHAKSKPTVAIELNASDAHEKIAFVVKIVLGLCIHVGNRFTVHELNASSSKGSAQNLLILPNFPSSIFTFAVLLYMARIEWINENYFHRIPFCLRLACNIGITLSLTKYLLNTVWITMLTWVKYIFLSFGLTMGYLMADQYRQQLRDIKYWSQSNESTACFGWCTAAIILFISLDDFRKSWKQVRNSVDQMREMPPKSIVENANRPGRCICR